MAWRYGRDRPQRRGGSVGGTEAVIARRDGEARRHTLHVVLEWPWQGLVEIIEIEEQGPVGRGESTEVRQMRVAAQLDGQAGRRGVLEIGRHDLRRAPVEGERRRQHSTMAHRHQVRLSG